MTGRTLTAPRSTLRTLPGVLLPEFLSRAPSRRVFSSRAPSRRVVDILTGDATEIAPWLASHQDVNALDLAGVTDPAHATALQQAAADTLKRVIRPATTDWTADPGTDRLRALLETKTVRHPRGL